MALQTNLAVKKACYMYSLLKYYLAFFCINSRFVIGSIFIQSPLITVLSIGKQIVKEVPKRHSDWDEKWKQLWKMLAPWGWLIELWLDARSLLLLSLLFKACPLHLLIVQYMHDLYTTYMWGLSHLQLYAFMQVWTRPEICLIFLW